VATFRKLMLSLLALATLAGVTVAWPAPASAAVIVDGAGSTWSQIAVDQWRADVARQGVTINYQGVGSSAGRVAYYQGQVDFAVSEIPFQDGSEGGVNEIQAARNRPYVYLPIVAGGTAFMYNLTIGGQRFTDLRLSPRTLAKIFTGAIKNWNDPAISSDNRGRVFPSLPIKVVIRSDGSGTSAQFTAFMASQTPAEWSDFCRRAGLGGSCPATSLYPNPPSAGFAAQQFSDGVANFVAAPFNNGAITYVEYGYAKQRGFPVASVSNKAGFFAQPSAQNVSIALQGARINPDGTQILKGVYEFADPRTYPVSSYSYMIVPTTETGPFKADEGEPLGRYILYFLCAGQQKAEQLGYSPLPRNLVQIGFEAVRKIPGAPRPPELSRCANPTITGDFITGKAPQPDPDDKATPVPPNSQAPGGAGGGGPVPGAPTGGASTGGGTAAAGGGSAGGGASAGAVVADGVVDPALTEELAAAAAAGEIAAATDPFSTPLGTGGVAATAQPIEPGGKASTIPVLLYVLIGLTALAGLFGLPALGARLDARREST
jgi:phosphate transport system substrate-binding protein